ncbi:Abi family protein [Lactobacillus hominis]|uniref:Abi family protein n=1 Tax=Lactobacillus hominis DSM 23910 = CRBIP 24.179 TaxID=1423758 RepID=I7L5B2_9LACO|nr:Abi family protein [Lactobacillus hominis]KRM85295.1 hypothetical protein FC41_GL001277 [Lactobacillus hominis DSM 23910 = CRBIP 24.179]MCT3347629.1 Abi family protein [Lactobacillus hominis]CCI81292.1 Putative uncharacterized protein [Lactobacillus hominis DSM 23910 = CRBIP 24.179]
MPRKRMCTTTELIQHLKSKGITFSYMDTAEAQHMLDTTNYYFKLTSYRKNFAKDNDEKYINLDFAYLTDLAAIDAQLREYLLELTLDIEHGIKTFIITNISNNSTEDGYSIVQEFKNKYPAQYEHTLTQLNKNRYLHDLYKKYHSNMPIWVFMEISSFGVLSLFTDFYYKKYKTKNLRQIHAHLKFCKNIRNACAHSDPFLINLFSDKEFLRHPSAPVMSIGEKMNISKEYITDLKINDLISTFYLHRKIQSSKLAEHRVREGKRLLNRFNRHNEWYSENQKINTFISILAKLIDYLS